MEGNWQLIEVSKMKKAKWNYKYEDEEKQQKLYNQIKKNGQLENVIVRELKKDVYEVVNGNHRLPVFKKLNIKKVMCYNCGKITLRQAQRIAVETNETAFPADQLKLAELILNITKEFDVEDLANTMPYTQNEIESQIDMLNYEWDKIMMGGEDSDEDGFVSIKIEKELRDKIIAKVARPNKSESINDAIKIMYNNFK